VLVTGGELSVFAAGFIPREDLFARIAALRSPAPEVRATLAEIPARLNAFLDQTITAVRAPFGGEVTYASLPFEQIEWTPFDFVAVDAYRDTHDANGYREGLRRHFGPGKPVAVTEFDCCTYRGAAGRGARGWLITDRHAEPRRLDAEYVRDEDEQATYLRDLLQVFEQEGVDSAFWFTFAGYIFADQALPHCSDPRYDLDLASYGVVKVLSTGSGTVYPDMTWEPKASFHALATAYST